MKSLGKDILYKMLSQGISFVISIITMGIVARTLGPLSYGIYNFITDFFQKFQKLILAGSMAGYYVKLSKNPDSLFSGSYHLYLLILIPLSIALVFLGFILGISDFIWPNKEIRYVYFGALIILLTVQNKGLSHTFDGAGATRYFELLLSIGYVFNGLSIISMFYLQILNLDNYFFYNIFYQTLLTFIGIFFAVKRKLIFFDLRLKNKILKNLIDIFKFSRPLVLYAIFVFFVGIADRWLIEYYYGEYDQGIFSLAFKISSLILLLAAPFERLLLRESSKLANKDHKELKNFIESSFTSTLFIGLGIASFISIYADNIISIIGGEAYRDAYTCLYILSFAFGANFVTRFMANINLAEEKTLTHVFLGIPINLIALSLSCFLLIPNSISPELESFNSVAIKTLSIVCLHFVLVTTIISIRLKLDNFYLISAGILVPSSLFLIANFSRTISEYFATDLIGFLLGATIYFLLIIILLFLIIRFDARQRKIKVSIINFLDNNLGFRI